MIRRLLICMLGLILGFAFVYLLGVFYEQSFDAKGWSELSRGITVFIGGIFSLGCGALMTHITWDKE